MFAGAMYIRFRGIYFSPGQWKVYHYENQSTFSIFIFNHCNQFQNRFDRNGWAQWIPLMNNRFFRKDFSRLHIEINSKKQFLVYFFNFYSRFLEISNCSNANSLNLISWKCGWDHGYSGWCLLPPGHGRLFYELEFFYKSRFYGAF